MIARAQTLLQQLENQSKRTMQPGGLAEELPLFSHVQPASASAEPHPLETALADITPDSLSPREALDLLYELKGKV